MAPLLKVSFPLEQDEDGYPPAAVESVWAQEGTAPNEYILDNIPFFARVATLGDVVVAARRDDGLWFRRIASASGNSLVRVVLFEPAKRDSVVGALEALGCSTECLPQHRLVAVNIPPVVSLPAVQAFLHREAAAGVLDHEEPLLRQ